MFDFNKTQIFKDSDNHPFKNIFDKKIPLPNFVKIFPPNFYYIEKLKGLMFGIFFAMFGIFIATSLIYGISKGLYSHDTIAKSVLPASILCAISLFLFFMSFKYLKKYFIGKEIDKSLIQNNCRRGFIFIDKGLILREKQNIYIPKKEIIEVKSINMQSKRKIKKVNFIIYKMNNKTFGKDFYFPISEVEEWLNK